MKLAFSTLGVPGMPVAEVVRLAAEHGYRGVELRAHPEEPVHPGLSSLERADVVEAFKAAGVEILTVAGYVQVASEGDDEAVSAELAELVKLARDLGARYVRVFPGGGDQDPADADATAARRLGSAAPAAADMGVSILLETHDTHRAGADVARIVGTVGHPRIGAIWDVLHTWLSGEEPSASHAVLAPHLGYVQVKDVASADDLTPLPLGAGVLPLADCLEPLAPETWVCWEYEKRWHPGAAELPGLLSAGREHLLRLGAPKG
ncbi:TIM barrel protein [Streptomyces sp. SID8374]|uniref:sugar phosphate isomerase/epimerase family protein n=1 Tax=unclassified Streptomyces TaxID=2593676 RepID=UPI00081E3B1C|nr:sugar phosphate isomerase/epimerase family protein [Streptomyces sp. ScaeMP-e83]MYR94040.1 TIM barrel protein [Streptomyces sp. SID4937]MYX13808.1 TIM barrel protein [Streptomyces sp. SID8374]SCD64152.1 Sugar phosphate isomerase/epimerase [Streptomyces sp. ScaeMP-e83]